MRVVGRKNRFEIELDPARALQRGRVLDAMLRGAAPAVVKGVSRGSHEYFNRVDAARAAVAASRLNSA